MNTKKLVAATAAMVFVMGAGAGAFAADNAHAVKKAMSEPAQMHAAVKAATEQETAIKTPFAGDTLVLDQGLLSKVESLKPAERAHFVKEREGELAKMPTAEKEKIEQSRQAWFASLPSEKQEEFSKRLEKALENLGLKKAEAAQTK